jgi:uncharacterized protein
MPFAAPPPFAAWQHRDARDGFEVVFIHPDDDGYRIEGDTAALEDGEVWTVRYVVNVDRAWVTRSAFVARQSASGWQRLVLEADDAGGWLVNGSPAPNLEGCADVDLESSAVTNALPVHRLDLDVGRAAAAPAAFVRVLDLQVERLEQRYVRLEDDASHQRYHYAAPRFGVECQLTYDEFGLILDYPGIATRMA